MFKVLNKLWTAYLRTASLCVVRKNIFLLPPPLRFNAAYLITVQYRDCWCPLAGPVNLLAHSLLFRASRHET